MHFVYDDSFLIKCYGRIAFHHCIFHLPDSVPCSLLFSLPTEDYIILLYSKRNYKSNSLCWKKKRSNKLSILDAICTLKQTRRTVKKILQLVLKSVINVCLHCTRIHWLFTVKSYFYLILCSFYIMFLLPWMWQLKSHFRKNKH